MFEDILNRVWWSDIGGRKKVLMMMITMKVGKRVSWFVRIAK